MRRQSNFIMTNKVVLHYDMIKVMMRIERKNNKSGEDAAALVREGTAANGDERETKEMEIAQETEEMEVQEEDNIQAEEERREHCSRKRREHCNRGERGIDTEDGDETE